jgi:hypothetical protein
VAERACHGPVRAAVGDAWSDEEIADVLGRMEEAFRRRKGRAPGSADRVIMAEAAAELTRSELKTALVQRRAEMFARISGDAGRAERDGMGAGLDEAERLAAFNVGSEKQGLGTSRSVDAEARARANQLLGQVELGLRALPGMLDRLANFWGRGEAGLDRKLAREIARLTGAPGIEPATDEAITKAARVFVAAQEAARKMQNDAGAWIDRLQGYVARQHHDRLRVAGGYFRELRQLAGTGWDMRQAGLAASKAAFREWRDFIRPLLDDRTFEGIDPTDAGRLEDAVRLREAGVIDDHLSLEERFLWRAWSDIVTGQSEVMSGASDLGEFRAPAGKARAMSRSRVLHFTGPDAWMDYHERFGRGSVVSVIMGDLERAGRNAALIARWGPNPQAAFDNEVVRLTEQARARGDVGAMARLHTWRPKAEFGELTGEAQRPDNLRLALVGRWIRVDQAMAKLGGMVLSAVGSDQALAAQAMKRAGGSFLQGYTGAFTGILRMGSEDAKAAALALDAGARSYSAHLSGRFASADGPIGWAASAQRLFYRVNLFEFVADGHRAGVAAILSRHLGEEATKGWEALNAGTRETLERYGVNGPAWELIRRGVAEAEPGARYLTFDHLAGISDDAAHDFAGLEGKARTPEAAAAVRDGLDLRMRTMVGSILDDSLTEPRARERVGLTRGLKAGTVMGEAIRLFTQFWSFNQAIIGRHIVPAARGYAGAKPVSLLAHLILATTLGGYLSLQAKQIAKGRSPRALHDEDGSLSLVVGDEHGFHFGRLGSVWLASLLQGGGLGIYGDYLFGEANRNGLGATLSSFGGPAVSELEAVGQVVRSAVSGNEDDAAGDLARIGARNVPFANLWYARVGLDYFINWRLQEALSPGYLDRYQRRVEEREGSTFFIPPTEAAQ